MGEQALDVELRVTRAARNVGQRWHLARHGVGELITPVRLHAVSGGEQKVARNRRRGAKGAVGA